MMEEQIRNLFGEGHELTPLQMGCRAFLMFFFCMALVRISGRRSFGMQSPFDITIMILLGGILSRGAVGASPFGSTLAAGLVLVVLHRLLGWLSMGHHALGQLIKGSGAVLLYENGVFHRKHMHRHMISEKDLMEAIRSDGHVTGPEGIAAAYLERNGRISIIKKH